ncbi:nucleotide exchange factor GrpE [Microbacterium sp. B35-04]|uniref:nucleotide exchange factor GrpE n=1 Tax=unclassified Microbacterium TaxID=2609290 RepID=UPI0013D015DC|nr:MULTISPECIES: nucleotide exchange factor GrpE [unclassified Microbacterium]KAF2413600.1 nucleotide exchange factor GrpE [Microbacterium sp. B35-04]KAF2420829.1 nucleotide exchange factor GrpE [Microbacterium sp. B35-30]
MADKDHDPTAGSGAGDEEEVRPAEEGSEAQASGPVPQDGDAQDEGDELTVDDILGSAQNADAAAEDAVLADLESALLNDLKRLQAEYANYRRRTEEQREVEIERAQGAVAKGLLPVLDDLDRADKHGDLEEGSPFAAIAEKLRGVAERMGLSTYGAAGEAFDPQHHEAIFQVPTPGATDATILEVVEIGYRLGSVELRPAKVVVAVPAD